MMGMLSGIYFSSFGSLIAGDFGEESKKDQSIVQSPGRMRRFTELVRRSSFRRNSGSSSQENDNHSVVVLGSPSMSESSIASSLQAHDDVLEKAKEALTGILKAASGIFKNEVYSSAIDTHGDSEVDRILEVLDHIKDVLNVHYVRGVPDFATSYEETLKANFAKCDQFDPKNVYTWLGFPSIHEGVKKSNEAIRLKINDRKKNHEDICRQMEYMFRNSESKHIYDTYVSGGIASVEALSIDQDDFKNCQYLLKVTGELQEELRDTYKRTIKK